MTHIQEIIFYLCFFFLAFFFITSIIYFLIKFLFINKKIHEKFFFSKEKKQVAIAKRSVNILQRANILSDALIWMSKRKIGSLIVITNKIDLNNYVSIGEILNAKISSYLICSIFFKSTPLHDGAMIINNDKIISVASYLPMPASSKLRKSKISINLGSRHRSALEISNISDAICFVTSESTGNIKVAKNNKLTSLSKKHEDLASNIYKLLLSDDSNLVNK